MQDNAFHYIFTTLIPATLKKKKSNGEEEWNSKWRWILAIWTPRSVWAEYEFA